MEARAVAVRALTLDNEVEAPIQEARARLPPQVRKALVRALDPRKA